jgi:hypothetical protein
MASIRLHGVRNLYTSGDFDFVHFTGMRAETMLENHTGAIKVDWKKHLVIIDVLVDGKPFFLNGPHRFKNG